MSAAAGKCRRRQSLASCGTLAFRFGGNDITILNSDSTAAARAAVFPQATVEWRNGAAGLNIGGAFHPPFFLMTSPGALRGLGALGLGNVRLLTLELRDEANGRAPVTWWTGMGQYQFETVDRALQDLLDVAPESYLAPRIIMDAPDDWLDAHPDDIVGYADPASWDDTGSWGGPRKASWASAAWRRDAGEALRQLIRHAAEQPYASRIIGWHVGSGVYGEWHYPNPVYYPDTSPAFHEAYKFWLAEHYPNDPPEARIPTVGERRSATHNWLRDPVADRWLIDYARCLHESGATALLDLARVVKEETARRSLVVAFNGYLPDLGTNHEADHRAFHLVLESDDVDVLSSPHTYNRRKPGQDGMIRGFLGSVRLHGKLWLDENDDRTHLTTAGSWQVNYTHVKSEWESVEMLWRGFAQALTHGCGLWFMDQKGLWETGEGPGWYGSAAIVEALNAMRRVMDSAYKQPASQPAEVAVIGDFESAFYIADTDSNDTGLLHRMYTDLMESLNRAGAPFDLYEMHDFSAKALGEYKVYIFPDAFHLSAAALSKIEELRRHTRTLLFLGVPGCASDNDFSLDRTRRLCVPPQHSDEFEQLMGAPTAEPLIVRSPDEKPWRNGNTWYVPGGTLATQHLRGIYRSAGTHVWIDTDDVLMAGCGFVAVYGARAGDKCIDAGRPVTWVDVRTSLVVSRDTERLNIPVKVGETALFELRE